MIQWMLAIRSLVPLPFRNPTWTSGSSGFMYCWSLVWRILNITLLALKWVQLCGSLSILWHCLSLRLEWKHELTSLAQYHDDYPETFQTDSIPKAISKTSTEHLEVHGSHTVEACLGEFWALRSSMWDECNCVVVWAFFGIAFLLDWHENWPFPVM